MSGDIKVNDPDTSPEGTARQGRIDVTYQRLVECFGPHMGGDGHKVDAEWVLEFPEGAVATVYNYKDGRNYLGAEGLPVEDITDWHIGGHIAGYGTETSRLADVVALVHEAVAARSTAEPVEPAHDGGIEPLPEPEPLGEGDRAILTAAVLAESSEGFAVALPADTEVLLQGDAGDGMWEATLAVILRCYIPRTGMTRPSDGEDDQ